MVLPVDAEGDCYLCVPPDPGIAAAALGASNSGDDTVFDCRAPCPSRHRQTDRIVTVRSSSLAEGAATAPPATADSATRSQWLTRDAAARLAIRNHQPLAECAHFGQHRTTQALYDAVVARCSSPATAMLGRLLLPYLFPELSAFATVEDLVSHLRTSDARYRATVPAEFLDKNQPPMFITLYFIVTRLPDSLRSVRDHFLSLDPTSLTVDLPEQHLLAAETIAIAVGAARGTPHPPFFEGCSPSPLAPSYASAAAANVSIAEDVGAASASAKRRSNKGKGGRGGGGGSGGGGGGSGSGGGGAVVVEVATDVRAGQTCGKLHTQHRCFSRLDDTWRGEIGDEVEHPRWADLLRSGVAIFDLDYDAILSAMYALSASAKGDCYRCVPPDPGIAAAALGASESGTLPSTAPSQALHTFTLDSGASCCFFRDSTTLTPLPTPVSVRLAHPSEGHVVARFSTVLPCSAVLTGSLSGLHLPSFSTNLVSASVQVATSYSCRLLSHQTLLWHHRLGDPSLPAFVACTPVFFSQVYPGLYLPSRPRLPRSAFLVSRGDIALLLTPPRSPRRLLPCRLSTWTKGEVVDVLIPWICTVCLQLRERFRQDLLVLHLHSDRGVMEVARTSMIHAASPHFLWPFAVRYAAHELNFLPRVSLPETSPTLRWTREVGDASFFQDVTFDESVPFYCLFPYRPPPPLPLFLAPGPPPVDPLPPKGPSPSGVSWVDPLPSDAPVKVAVGSGAARGAVSGGAESGGAGLGSEGTGSGGAELGGEEPGGGESEGAESGGAEPRGAASSGGAGGAGDGAAGVTAGAGGTGVSTDAGPRGARSRGAGATGTGGVGGAGAGDPTEPGAAGAGGSYIGGAGARGAGVGGTGAGGAGAAGAGAVDPGAGGAGGTVRPRPYFVPLLLQVLSVPPSASLTPPLLCPPPDQSQPPLLLASPLPAPSPYTEQSGGLTEHREPTSRPVSPVRTARRAPRSRPPPVPGTHTMALRPSSVPLRVPLPAPPEYSLPESATASALVAELLDFAVACRLDYATSLIAESASASPSSVGGECALGTDVLEDRQEDFECLAAAVPCFASMLLAPEGDPDAPDIPTLRSYAEAITAFLQGSLHEEIWLRLPRGFTGSFPAGTQWSLRRPVYGLRQAPREWHDTLRTTLAALGFAPATADPSLFLRTDTSLLPFYVLVYVDDLVFATANTEALTLVKSELQKRHTCTDPGQSTAHHHPDSVTHGAPGPSALRCQVLIATAHSSVYQPLALSSTFGRALRPHPSAPRPLGLSVPGVTTTATAAIATATATTAASACCTAMASLRVLEFNHEGRPVQFDTWLDDLQLYLLSDSKDSVSLFDLASGAAPTPPATADSATRSHTSTATTALGRLLLPYLYPVLSAFATVEDLVSHLRTSDARYRATEPAEFLDRNQPPIFITLDFIVTCLPDSLRSVRDHFLSLDPTSLTVDLLEQHLLAAETIAVAVGAARGTPRPPFFQGTSGLLLLVRSTAAARARMARVVEATAVVVEVAAGVVVGAEVEVVEAAEVVAAVGLVAGVGALVAAVEEAVGVVAVKAVGLEAVGLDLGMEALVVASGSSSSVGATPSRPSSSLHPQHRCFSCLDVTWRAEFGDDIELPHWADLLMSRIAIFDLHFDAILSAMYTLSVSAEDDCYWCVPPDPGIAAAALGASESGTLPGTVPAQALHTFTLDSGDSRCFFRDSTTLPAPIPIRLADPSGGPVVARSSSVLPCPAVSTSPPALACPALHFVRRGAVACCSLLLLVSPYDFSSKDSSHGLCQQLRERFNQDLPVLHLHSDRGGEFSSELLREFCQGEGILQSFTLPDSPQQSGIAKCRIGLVMEVARTSMIHAAAPHFLWPFVVRPRVSLPETSPTLCWTGEVGDASVFRFYHPTSRRVLSSHDVMFDEPVPFYRLFPYRSAPPPPLPLFLAPGPPPVDPLPPQGPAPSGVSQVDPLPCTAPAEVAVGSNAAPGAAYGGAASGGAEPGGAGSEGAGSGAAEPEGVELGGAESEGAESGGTEPRVAASSGGPAGASQRLSPQQLREWLVRRACLWSGAPGAGDLGDARAGGAGVTSGAGGTGVTAATGPGGARTRGVGAAGTGGVGGAGARDPTEPGATGAGDSCTVGGTGAGGAGAAGAGAVDLGAGGGGGTVRPRPYFVPLLQQVLGVPSSTGLPPPLLCPLPDQSQPSLQPASSLPAPSSYTEQSGGLTEHREPASRPVSPVRTARRAPHSRPPPVPGMHAMALRPSSVPLCVPLPTPLESSLPEVPDPEFDPARVASPTVSRLLATAVIDPSFESAAASALVAELLDFAAACRLDYTTTLVAKSASASPLSAGGECALGTDVLEDRQEDFECLAAAVPCFASMLLAPEGDPDAPDIPTPRSYAEAIMGTYVDKVPPPGANIVDGMWIFRVKRPPGSPHAFKARYVARGVSQRQGVDYFETFSPTPKMTTLRVLLHVTTHRDYELHCRDFTTAFLQGSLHEEIWLRRPPGFTESFPATT
ncbi:unnamed protein product [Closterium sp. NIES-54]